MNSNMYIPFTYHIAWTEHNLHYYGVRYAQGTTPEDLWTKYHTSSLKVEKLRESIGEPDIIEVRKTFISREQAIDWEYKVLTRLGVVKRDDWINQACTLHVYDNRGENHPFYGKHHTKDTKIKMSAARTGKNHPGYGKVLSKETREKISRANSGQKRPEEFREKMSKIMTEIYRKKKIK